MDASTAGSDEADGIYRVRDVTDDEVELVLVDDLEAVIKLPRRVVAGAEIGAEYAVLADESGAVAEPLRREVKVSGHFKPEAEITLERRDGTTAEVAIDPPLSHSEFSKLQNQGYCAVLGVPRNGVVPGEVDWRIDGHETLDAWRREQARQADEAEKGKKAREEERERLRHLDDRRDRLDRLFINPYTFVPLREGPQRSEASGHSLLRSGTAELDETVAGSFDVVWQVETPLMCGVARRSPSASGEEGTAEVVTFAEGADGCVIPGSSIKGAVRALHEALVDGCMRVLDTKFVPVYREHASPEHRRGYVLGYIEDTEQGRPTKIRLSGEVQWVKAADVRAARDDNDKRLASGQSYTIVGVATDEYSRSKFENPEITPKAEAPTEGDYTILVAATNSARDKNPFWCATSELSATVVDLSETCWSDFVATVAGADELGPEGRLPVRVEHAREGMIGDALGPSKKLAKGQVVWVKPNAGRTQVTQISLSALWRSKGHGTVEDRAGGYVPCASWEALCASCQIFGSAETDGSGNDGQQKSYRAHVRFGEGRMEATGGTRLRRADLEKAVQLAPLLSPRPGSGQFYLTNRSTRLSAKKGAVPLRQWGSAADSPLRRLRGRKFYWHGDPEAQRKARTLGAARHELRGQSEATTSRVDLAPPGTIVRSTVHFEGLTRLQLGSLLMSVDPTLAFGPEVRTRLGGAKPLGLGTVKPAIDSLAVRNASSRYLGSGPAVSPSPIELIDEFKQAAGEGAREAWPDVAAVLRPDPVTADSIWYPPGAPWEQAGTEDFDHSYEFFGKSDGAYVSDRDMTEKNYPDHVRQLVTLAAPRAVNQDLPIDPVVEDDTWWRDEQ